MTDSGDNEAHGDGGLGRPPRRTGASLPDHAGTPRMPQIVTSQPPNLHASYNARNHKIRGRALLSRRHRCARPPLGAVERGEQSPSLATNKAKPRTRPYHCCPSAPAAPAKASIGKLPEHVRQAAIDRRTCAAPTAPARTRAARIGPVGRRSARHRAAARRSGRRSAQGLAEATRVFSRPHPGAQPHSMWWLNLAQ